MFIRVSYSIIVCLCLVIVVDSFQRNNHATILHSRYRKSDEIFLFKKKQKTKILSRSNISRQQRHIRQKETSLYFFGDALKNAFADAFANEDVGERENAGLSSRGGPALNNDVIINGEEVPGGAIVGQKVTTVAMKARVRIPVSCGQGSCGVCRVLMNGKEVMACQSTIPSGECYIDVV